MIINYNKFLYLMSFWYNKPIKIYIFADLYCVFNPFKCQFCLHT